MNMKASMTGNSFTAKSEDWLANVLVTTQEAACIFKVGLPIVKTTRESVTLMTARGMHSFHRAHTQVGNWMNRVAYGKRRCPSPVMGIDMTGMKSNKCG